MKIEKISDKQIRCTLNPGDLHSRQLSIRELAYGGDKVRSLFHEMLQLACDEIGFVTEDIPLMIEAVPLSSDGIMLIITKLEDPDELDTRFSRFAPHMDSPMDVSASDHHESANEFSDSILEVQDDTTMDDPSDSLRDMTIPEEFKKLFHAAVSSSSDKDTEKKVTDSKGPEEVVTVPVMNRDVTSIFIFRSLEVVMNAAHILKGIYLGENTLFKSPQNHCYYLILHKSEHTAEDFNKICNVMTEYGERRKGHIGTEAYYMEHMETLIAHQALQILGNA